LRSSSRFLRRLFQDFKGFWESKFGGKKEPERDGEPNGSVKKRTADLAIYEQYEQQVCPSLALCSRWNACMQVFSVGPVPPDPRSGFILSVSGSGRAAGDARRGDSRREC
jgi:hypothetical protein